LVPKRYRTEVALCNMRSTIKRLQVKRRNFICSCTQRKPQIQAKNFAKEKGGKRNGKSRVVSSGKESVESRTEIETFIHLFMALVSDRRRHLCPQSPSQSLPFSSPFSLTFSSHLKQLQMAPKVTIGIFLYPLFAICEGILIGLGVTQEIFLNGETYLNFKFKI